jgi:hypothetical protein
MEGSSEYIEYAVADSRQGVALQLGVWAGALVNAVINLRVLPL